MSDQEQGSRNTPAPSADLPRADPRIEDYLDHVCAPLVDRVPYMPRLELRDELRMHLASLVEAYQELGSASDDAISQALAQFGNPKVVARAWERATRAHPVLATWAATLIALGGYALTMVAEWACGPFHLPVIQCSISAMGDCGTPLLVGLITGALSPDRPARGNFYAVAVLLAIALGMCWVLGGAEWPAPFMAAMQNVRWLLIGCGAAMFGAELRKRREQRPERWSVPA